MPKVNLDALIPREDFELQDNVNSGKKKETISIEDLKPDSFDDDINGEKTIFFLKNARKIAYRLNSNKPSSLGLHPIVYCYSRDGRYRTVSFLAVVDFVMELKG